MAMSKEEARTVLLRSELLYTDDEVDEAILELADQITEDLADTMPVVLVVMIGGLVTAGKLLPRLNFPLEVDYLHATRYREQTRGTNLQWLARPRTPLAGRHVLVVDDILDEGHTLAGILDYCRVEGAVDVRTMVMVRKHHDRCVAEARAQYVGLDVDDRYVFGCGMDYKGVLRNAPGIYAAADED